jgi:hypothetical protein
MKKFDLISLPTPKEAKDNKQPNQIIDQEKLNETMRMCVDVKNDLIEKIKNYAYWEGLTQQDILLQALEFFIKDKTIKDRPDTLKLRKRNGRKKKA